MGERCKVLIVDDEIISRQALRYIIGQEPDNFEIVGEASNGADALQKIEQLWPHVVISDMVMPVMDGSELIRSINLRYPEIYIIVLSGHDEFDLVKDAFRIGVSDYILKPRLEPGELLEKLHAISERLGFKLELSGAGKNAPSQLLKALLEQNSLPRSTDETPLFPYSDFWLLACNVKDITSVHADQGRGAAEIFYTAASSNLVECHYCDTLCCNDTVWALLLNIAARPKKEVTPLLSAVVKSAAERIPNAFFAVSGPYRQLADTASHFQKIMRGLNRKFYNTDQHLFVCDDQMSPPFSVAFDMKLFADAFATGNMALPTEYLDTYFEQIRREGVAEHEVKKNMEYACYRVVTRLEEIGYSVEQIKSAWHEMFTRINHCRNSEQLLACTKEILEEIRAGADLSVDEEARLMRKIGEYIRTNSAQPIALNQVAEQFHLSYTHLSSLFNQHFHLGFNEYLNEIRVEKAKELLICPSIRLGEISEAVGYSEQSYFGKVFKKATGLTPSEYRKRALH